MARLLFVAATVPDRVRTMLREALAAFQPAITRPVPEERWHMTVVFLGQGGADGAAAALVGAMPSFYTPTVRITHLGAGRAPGQLWAYVEPTPLLADVRQEVLTRLAAAGVELSPETAATAFVPHIRLADVASERAALLPTVPLPLSFPLSELILFESVPAGAAVQYEPRARLPLSS